MGYRYELQRRVKDIRWASKWAAIERYRKFKKAYTESKAISTEITTAKEVLSEDITKISKQPEVTSQLNFPTPELPEEPSFKPPTQKEAAIKINTEPTVIEMAGVISQDKVIEPVAEFIFRMPSGEEIGRAKSLEEFAEVLRRAPLESVLHHANEGHFITWLEFKGYKKLAKKIKNTKGTSKKVRKRLLKIISRNR